MKRGHEENVIQLFKAVQEGTLCDAEVLAERAKACGVDLDKYYVLHLELPPDDETDCQMKKKTKAIFPYAESWQFHVGREDTYIVLTHPAVGILQRCSKLATALVTMLGRPISFGVSMQGSGAGGLRTTFEQADAALEKSFFQPEKLVHLFYAESCAKTDGNRDITALMTRFSAAVARGSVRTGLALLEELLHLQRSELRPSDVRAEGLHITSLCQAELGGIGIGAEEMSFAADCRAAVAACRTFHALCGLLRALVKESCRAVAKKLESGGSAVLDARNYIERNYCQPISLSEVAAAIQVNPGYLSRRFKSEMGVNVVDAINRKRMTRAKELLAAGRMKIGEVADAVGVVDTAYFSHLFRRYAGMSPRAYQNWKLHGEKQ